MLQRAAPTSAPRDEDMQETTEAPKSPQESLRTIKEASPSAIDPAIDPALSGVSSPASDSGETARDKAEEVWVENIRVIEALRKLIADRLERKDYEEDDEDVEMADAAESKEEESNKAEESLYPVLRAAIDSST